MNSLVRYISLLLIMVLPVGCVMDEDVKTSPMIDVSIKVALADVTDSRAQTVAGNGNEKMHTLRVVIVRNAPDGVVEDNRFIDLPHPIERYGLETFEVRGDETKYIYFFVNEKHTSFDKTADFDFDTDIVIGNAFPKEKLFDSKICLSEMDASGNLIQQMPVPIPMNSLYKLDVGRLSISKTFYITRTATKFTYIIQNNSNCDYQLSRLTVSNQAFTQYYMQYIKNEVPMWNSDNVGILSEITDFNTPVEGQSTYHHTYLKDYGTSVKIPAEKRVKLAPIYLTETKRFKAQAYRTEDSYYQTTLSLTGLGDFTGRLGVGAGVDGVRSDLPYQLPRNTHVVVTATINQSGVNWEVDVYPYTAVVLDPVFGLE